MANGDRRGPRAPADVAIIVPTLGRPHALAPLVESIDENTSASWRVVFVLDRDDRESGDVANGMEWPGIQVVRCDGTYPVKMNAGVRACREPWVLLTADDVRFHPGWWDAAMALDAPGVGVIGTNDLHNRRVQRGEYATQILVARWYVERGTVDEPGKVFHEGYHHNCIDVELCETAQARDAYAHAHDSVIEHLHPNRGHREVDETDRKGNRANRDRDRALLRRRRALWGS